MVPRDRFIALTGERIEKNRSTQRPSLLFGSRLADGFQSTEFLICELQRLAPLQEGHSPLKHFLIQMYRYLENGYLVPDVAASTNATLNICSQGALNLQKLVSGTLTNIAANELRANVPYVVLKAASGYVVVPLEGGSGGGGDLSSNTATSVDGELALFSGTGGKTIRRATTTGVLKGASGVLGAAVARTDYLAPGMSTGFYCEDELLGKNALTNTSGACDLLGEVGGGGGAITAPAGEQGTPGIFQISTSTFSNGAFAIRSGLAVFRFGGGAYTEESRVRITTLSDGTETFTFRSGFLDTSTAEAVDGCFFRYAHVTDTGRWQGVCRNNNTETTTTAGAGPIVSAATWYKLQVAVNATGSSVDFSVDGSSIGAITANIPTGSGRETGFAPAAILKSAGTTARTADIDYTWLKIDLSSAR
jgi:hypothetical protein